MPSWTIYFLLEPAETPIEGLKDFFLFCALIFFSSYARKVSGLKASSPSLRNGCWGLLLSPCFCVTSDYLFVALLFDSLLLALLGPLFFEVINL